MYNIAEFQQYHRSFVIYTVVILSKFFIQYIIQTHSLIINLISCVQNPFPVFRTCFVLYYFEIVGFNFYCKITRFL